MFAVLGQLLDLTTRTDRHVSDWERFVCAELARVCAAVRAPLQRWLFTGQFLGGAVRQDLLTAFMSGDRRVRLPDAIGSLHILAGLRHVECSPELRALTRRMAGVRDGGAGDAHVGVNVQQRLAIARQEQAEAEKW